MVTKGSPIVAHKWLSHCDLTMNSWALAKRNWGCNHLGSWQMAQRTHFGKWSSSQLSQCDSAVGSRGYMFGLWRCHVNNTCIAYTSRPGCSIPNPLKIQANAKSSNVLFTQLKHIQQVKGVAISPANRCRNHVPSTRLLVWTRGRSRFGGGGPASFSGWTFWHSVVKPGCTRSPFGQWLSLCRMGIPSTEVIPRFPSLKSRSRSSCARRRRSNLPKSSSKSMEFDVVKNSFEKTTKHIFKCRLVGGFKHFFHNTCDVILPIDELIFFRGVGQPPTSFSVTIIFHHVSCLNHVKPPFSIMLVFHLSFQRNFWLVVWNFFFIFPYIGNNNPNWLSYFSEG